ncbi:MULTISPECIES: MetQ/NlpA family ABC transporter substrate-binding protein [unclassified Arthrobacter]|uniref:MetQ/NlpA family ABC transporter substrate-binding protein n=1 Tax=unclassified Arthrobacter TaxID=235627 RepID=UPI001490C648|nr:MULTISPECIES: MetQ/NlpA family ABC transporter substrate-binding protein [unclassified Arthrobacter]MBE0010078.1 methionine ABC transporter substrate-binding protein [Arthrobacter sp. AET 35A]NOJ63956.1 methionine ABC transporter substrate-binding protein [Arthrobacter sp. 147(2020)]
MNSRKLLSLAVVPFLALTVACGSSEGSDSGTESISLGVVGASDPEWGLLTEAAAEEGIDLEVIDFAEYTQPNPALSEEELDLNQFQHLVYLARYNVSSGEELTPIGSTAIYPLGLYSTQYGSVDEIPEGSTVAVPNDESNLARGLLVLQSAGLVVLDGGGSAFSTIDDIDEEASKVTVTTLEASLTPTSLPDVAAAIINNDFVQDAGLNFEDAIAQDDPTDPAAVAYVNVFAARAGEENNETYQKLVSIYQENQEVQDAVQETSGGTAEFLVVTPEELQSTLDTVEEDTAAQG